MNIIYIHIPKNGGSTFRSIFASQYSSRQEYGIRVINNTRQNWDEFFALSPEEKQNIKAFHGHFTYGVHEHFEQAFKYITLLRHPVSRVASFYKYMLRTKGHQLHEEVKGYKNFEEFVIKCRDKDLHNCQCKWISGIQEGASEKEILEKAKENIENDFLMVGFLEQFDASLILLKRLLGWDMPYYRKLNTSSKKKKVKMNPFVEEEIIKRNQADLSLYYWAKKRFEEKIEAEGDSFQKELSTFRFWMKYYFEPRSLVISKWNSLKHVMGV